MTIWIGRRALHSLRVILFRLSLSHATPSPNGFVVSARIQGINMLSEKLMATQAPFFMKMECDFFAKNKNKNIYLRTFSWNETLSLQAVGFQVVAKRSL